MNEHIRAIATRANVTQEASNKQWHMTDEQFNRVSELIVKECAAIAWFADQYGIGANIPIYKQIKEHFGVE